MIVLSCFVFAIVLVMLGYSIWKYRAKPGDESDGEPIHGNTKLEITWTVIPTVIVLFGAIYSWIILGDIESKASNPLRLDVTAQQFKWTFNYPQPNGKVVSSNVLVVPDGPPARRPPDGARRAPFVLGAGVADQARRWFRPASGATTSTTRSR